MTRLNPLTWSSVEDETFNFSGTKENQMSDPVKFRKKLHKQIDLYFDSVRIYIACQTFSIATFKSDSYLVLKYNFIFSVRIFCCRQPQCQWLYRTVLCSVGFTYRREPIQNSWILTPFTWYIILIARALQSQPSKCLSRTSCFRFV